MKSVSQKAKSLNSQISSMLIEKGYEGIENKQYIYTFVGGLKTEWWFASGLMRVGHSSNRTENELELIKDRLIQNGFDEVKIGATFVDVPLTLDTCNVESFNEFIDVVETMIDLNLSSSKKSNISGVLFEGTNFSNAHERATTIGNRFMKMVCKASGMSDNYDSEWGTDDAGRIDAVEIDEETGKPISIYECQSGIQNGLYLDDEHLNKAMLRYPSDPEIRSTLKKIVILAGGYTKEHLDTIKWQSENLKMARNIEVILLKTVKIENKIEIERVLF